MGELWNREEERATDAWVALVDHSERYADLGFGSRAAKLRKGGPVAASLLRTPMIIDTDLGGDPDDAVAIAVAARAVPQLALVLTSDEVEGERARFARCYLDSLGRRDVRVVAGARLSDKPRTFCIHDLVPPGTPPQATDVIAAVSDVIRRARGHVRWVGLGPPSNLHSVLMARPELAERIAVTQMGGALRYRNPAQAEHNFRLDPQAAAGVLGRARQLRLVTSDVTFTKELELATGSPLYRHLAASPLSWARMLTQHLDRWFSAFHPASMQHDALTLSAALELPFVDFDFSRVALDDIGRMRQERDGVNVLLSRTADYASFMRWLTAQLGAIHEDRDAAPM